MSSPQNKKINVKKAILYGLGAFAFVAVSGVGIINYYAANKAAKVEKMLNTQLLAKYSVLRAGNLITELKYDKPGFKCRHSILDTLRLRYNLTCKLKNLSLDMIMYHDRNHIMDAKELVINFNSFLQYQTPEELIKHKFIIQGKLKQFNFTNLSSVYKNVNRSIDVETLKYLDQDFKNLNVSAKLVVGPTEDLKTIPAYTQLFVDQANWQYGLMQQSIYKSDHKVTIDSFKTIRENYKEYVLNHYQFFAAKHPQQIKQAFYVFYKSLIKNRDDKAKFNEFYLDYSSNTIVPYKIFEQQISKLSTIAAKNFEYTHNAPMVYAIDALFHGNNSMCYQITHKNNDLISLKRIYKAMSQDLSTGIELRKKYYNTKITNCKNINECYKKCAGELK